MTISTHVLDTAAGAPHPHAFVGAGPGKRTATVTRDGAPPADAAWA